LPEITARLIAAGRAATTPVAVIHWGTTARQQVVTGTLAEIATVARDVPPPSTIVIGEVVNLRAALAALGPVEAGPLEAEWPVDAPAVVTPSAS
jgi:siroheme synthase